MPEMTLSDAARWAGVTRATIHKALKGGRLSGRKDDSGEWRIDPSELERVYRPGKPVDTLVDASRDGVSGMGMAGLIAAKDREMALLREVLAEVRAQRDDAVEQRDRAMALAEAQTRLLTYQQEKASPAGVPASRPRFGLGWFRRSGGG